MVCYGSHGSPCLHEFKWVWFLMDMVFNEYGHFLSTKINGKLIWINGCGQAHLTALSLV